MKPRSLQIFHHKLLYHTSAISSNPTRSSYQPQISHSAHWIWLRVPLLCVMGLWIAFLTMIYAQIALKFPLFFKLHHFTFLPTLKSTTENISFASLLNEATKSPTGVFIAEGYIHGRHTAYLSAWSPLWIASITLSVYLSNAVLVNKLNFVPERIVPGRITVLPNSRWSYSSLGHHI